MLGAVHILRHQLKGGSFPQNMTIDEIYLGGSFNKKYDNMTVRGGREFP